MKKEIITEKRYSFELGGIELKTGVVTNDSPISIVLLKDKEGGGMQFYFTKQDIKNISTLFNELVSELEKEEIEKEITEPKEEKGTKEVEGKISADKLNLLSSKEVGTMWANCIYNIPNSRLCDTCFNDNGFTAKPKAESK